MAIQVTPEDRLQIQKRTIVYNPIYVNNMKETDLKGSYVLFYIFTKSSSKIANYSNNKCIIEFLNSVGKQHENTFVKIGNYASGSKSRWSSNKGDLIKNDGNRSPAARHSQDVLLNYPDLYLHFIMVVVSPDTVEKNLEDALSGIIEIHNKPEKITTSAAGKWNLPIVFSSTAKVSKKITDKIAASMAAK